jgi:N-acetylneuraminic acid mutarotase
MNLAIRPVSPIYMLLLVLLSNPILANDDVKSLWFDNGSKLNWSNLTQEQYINNLMACEFKIQEFEWSKNIWPKENKLPKPTFITVVEVDKIREQVMDNLYKQNILSTQFQIDINQTMLQHDIDRMAKNTKDAKGLKTLFALFNNDPLTIAQCVSRPYLVNKLIQDSFNQQETIHKATYDLARKELNTYLERRNIDIINSQVVTITFKRKDLNENLYLVSQEKQTKEEIEIELEEKEYQQKLADLDNKNLQQKPYAFIYAEILQKFENKVTVKILSWQKQNINQWLKTQDKNTQVPTIKNELFYLPVINLSKSSFNSKSGAVVADTWITGNSTGAPVSRQEHSAVWNGNEMIVWGGIEFSGYLKSGGLYNPVTDHWSPINYDDAPIERRLHTAVWNGSEMIVWGGEGVGPTGSMSLNTGGRYNPTSDSWVTISTIGAPNARREHSAVWTGSEMLIWGESGNTGGRYNPFDPNGGSWLATSIIDAPISISGNTTIWTGSELIVWGGFKVNELGNQVSLNSGGRYNPNNDSWVATSIDDAPISRLDHTAVWSGSEMIIWGGVDENNFTGFNSGGRYNPTTDSWLATSDLTGFPGRVYNSAIWSGSEMIIWGGVIATLGDALNTGGRYNPITNNWLHTSTVNAPTARNNHTAIWSGSEMMILGGDFSSNTMGVYYPYNTYNLGGVIAGLNGNQVILQNNGGDNLSLSANGTFEFNTAISQGADYEVTVLSNPQSASQTCTITNGLGMNVMAHVNTIAVNCVTNSFNVGVTVTGLAAGNSVKLLNIGGDLLEVNTNNILNSFSMQVESGQPYLISFDTQPTSPSQTCSIVTGEETGTINATDVNVAVICVTNKYNIGVEVSGLETDNFIVLTTNSQSLPIVENTSVIFPSAIDDGTSYEVLLTSQPTTPNQVCTITGGNSGSDNGSGLLSGEDVDLAVDCVTTPYLVQVDVSGLVPNSSVSFANGIDSLDVSSNGVFTLSDPNDGAIFNVMITSQPTSTNQTCLFTSSTIGVINSSDVLIGVECEINSYFIGGTISGLLNGNYMLLQNNTDDFKTITSNGAYIFNGPLFDEHSYQVQIQLQPDDPIQPCVVTNNSGILAGADVDNINITCELGIDLIYGQGFEDL